LADIAPAKISGLGHHRFERERAPGWPEHEDIFVLSGPSRFLRQGADHTLVQYSTSGASPALDDFVARCLLHPPSKGEMLEAFSRAELNYQAR